ncbi:MAG: hypothetical protein ACRD1G_21110, partial [Acidimicrobiales bacterium]
MAIYRPIPHPVQEILAMSGVKRGHFTQLMVKRKGDTSRNLLFQLILRPNYLRSGCLSRKSCPAESLGNVTETMTSTGQNSVSASHNASWSEYESGNYSNDSFAFANISYQSGGSDSTTVTALSTSTGSFGGTGNVAYSIRGAQNGANTNDFALSSESANGTIAGSDSGTASTTVTGGDNYSLTEQGSYALDSYNLSNYVYSANDSNRVNSQQTDSVTETQTATGSFLGGASEANSASVQGTWTSSGSPSNSGTFALGLGEDASASDNGTFTETVNATDTTTDTQATTFSESQYQSGNYVGGSFAFASVMYSQNSTSSATAQSSDTYSSTDTSQGYSDSYGTQDGYNRDGYIVSSGSNYSGQDTASGGATRTEQSVGSASVYEAGNFSNYSYGLSSFALTRQGGDTLTSSSSDNYTSTASGT